MNLVIGVTGATGTVYAVRLLEYLKDIEEITEELAVESAVRVTDSTGISYNKNGKLT